MVVIERDSTWRILGIDPGYDRCGVAFLIKDQRGKESLEFSDCITTDAALPFSLRLFEVGSKLDTLIKEFRPNIVALEDLFFNTNQKTATKVAEIRGMISYIASLHGCMVQQFTPPQVKMAVTGYGRSSKDQVMSMVPKLIHITKQRCLDDEIDAIAVALTSSAHARSTHTLSGKK